MTPLTEITLADGSRHVVEGDAKDVESKLLAAARGSIMELAWLTEADSGDALGINPEHLAMLRALSS